MRLKPLYSDRLRTRQHGTSLQRGCQAVLRGRVACHERGCEWRSHSHPSRMVPIELLRNEMSAQIHSGLRQRTAADDRDMHGAAGVDLMQGGMIAAVEIKGAVRVLKRYGRDHREPARERLRRLREAWTKIQVFGSSVARRFSTLVAALPVKQRFLCVWEVSSS